jgi:hypothetical protein
VSRIVSKENKTENFSAFNKIQWKIEVKHAKSLVIVEYIFLLILPTFKYDDSNNTPMWQKLSS